ncbi:hypothetical protein UF75_0718 [Desulfosporosinus sp. I2]|uniref:hypothetical protein n=1 Tax=Desulfosporosinus sp. I2 TaxID=1617025 RepID=UPI0005F09D44|nr:hypothetical protein [Desulfosporosinus sp. I2]KJR48831.1 hypothetical protein UF75_0718 [Desulfosporosinus sp. I2]
MINAQSSFIPLFFDEAETDLWLALQEIEPEERSSFIKAILRKALLGTSADMLLIKKNQNSESSVLDDTDNMELNEPEIQEDLPFSLEALFEVNVPEQDSERVVEPIRSTGLEYMMKHIIGTEDDEVVLKVLQGFPSDRLND